MHSARPGHLRRQAYWSVTPPRQRRVTLKAGARKLVCSADHFSSTWAWASSARYTGMWARPLRCVNHLANGARSGADLPDSADPPAAAGRALTWYIALSSHTSFSTDVVGRDRPRPRLLVREGRRVPAHPRRLLPRHQATAPVPQAPGTLTDRAIANAHDC
jgi:hypothetical protein